ncbi:hypothetical protein N0G65_000605 [Providencia rettgeri]|nr:hypothetical protein [Providencia rettgeri]
MKINSFKGVILFVLSVFLILMFLIDVNVVLQNIKIIIPEYILNNLKFIKKVFIPFMSLIVIAVCLIGFIMNKYSMKVEKLSLGGISILFDRREILFTNSVKNFLDTKRTLFCINKQYDNFAEVFQSYHETYNFIRQEMRILDPQKDIVFYKISNDILMSLNQFLTKNQNNYMRWYKYISETNQELIKLDEFDKDDINPEQRHFYNMPINDIQSKYYFYNDLIKEFKIINEFFTTRIAKQFNVDISKWVEKDPVKKTGSD